MIVWITGLSGSGKTTIGQAVYALWKARDPATVLIDGDRIREIFRYDQGDEPYSLEGRRRNAHRISQICAWLDGQDINVVCCILSAFEESRDWNRETYGSYLEVHLTASEQTLNERRSLYQEARSGKRMNVVGVDLPYVPPKRPHLTYATDDPDVSQETIVQDLFQHITRLL